MLLFDSLMLSGLRCILSAIVDAAAAEMEDDIPLREALLEAGVRLELGEISEKEFALAEQAILSRISEIRARRDTGTGPIAWIASAPGEGLDVEAAIGGDFHEAPTASASPALAVRPRQHRNARRPARAARRKD
jgi:hypothetical protein